MQEQVKEQEIAEATAPARGQRGRWYIIHCYSSMEDRVKKNLEQRIASLDMGNRIFEVVVPTEEVVEIKEGRRATKRERMYPGYVVVRMDLDDESWSVVRHTPGVTGFISADDATLQRTRPLPLTDAEVAAIFRRMAAGQPRAKIGFSVGQSVKITDGPFKDFIGAVDAISADKGKIRVLVSILGRETPVEMDFLQVERIS